MHNELSMRTRSQRSVTRAQADKPAQYFQQFKRRSQTVSSVNELLPGLNDISDAFEALPMDLVKYFTLLKEIDAKCIKTVPVINNNIANYIDTLHGENALNQTTKVAKLLRIRNLIHEVIPCLEEKMHVTSVAADIVSKHMYRINNDYKVVVGNNEIPELVRLGPLNHRALVSDQLAAAEAAKTSQLHRSETRREAMAAKRANKDGDDVDKKRKVKETTPLEAQGANGKKRRKENEKTQVVSSQDKKRTLSKPKREKDNEPGSQGTGLGSEPTYCYCNQVSFGEMVGCDGDTCEREWFHLPCIGFKNPPKGKWYCDDCLAKMKKGKV